MKPFISSNEKKGITRGNANTVLRVLLTVLIIGIAFISIFVSSAIATPTIIPSALPAGQLNVPYFAALTALSDNPPITWEYIGGILPPGLSLDPSGVISGVPDTVGTFVFFVRASDTVPPPTSAASFSITINPPPFVIYTTSLTSGKEATAYNATITASGGTTPYIWSISSGSLPSGLSLSTTTGYISGVPAVGSSGTHSFTVMVTDNSVPQRTAQQTLSIYIEKGSFEPTVTIGTGLEAGKTRVRIDGKQVATLSGGETLAFNLDLGASRTIAVDQIVEHPSEDNVRFKVEDDSQIVNETRQDAFFNYYTEYKLDIMTSPTQIITISGSGWHKKNSTITINARAEIERENQFKYQFSHWLLPDGTQASNDTLSYTVSSPGVMTAYYDTYYKLNVDSQYGKIEGDGWYKAGTQATWSLVNDKVPMEGLLGFFQGKYRASNSSGIITMDSPKTVTVLWEPDYLMPYILIPTVIAIIVLAIIGFYFLLRKPQPKLAPFGAPVQQPVAPRPIPQQHTTVVMIENKGPQAKQLPATTKEQLIEKFAELLDTYETEIKHSLGAPDAPQIQTRQNNMITAPVMPPIGTSEPDIVDAEVIEEAPKNEIVCGVTSKKLLRTIASKWRQSESSVINVPSEEKDEKEKTGLAVTWAKDLYHEWEISSCTLPVGHRGKHKGSRDIIYSLLNTIKIDQTYSKSEAVQPPSPHFTDSMPELEPDSDRIIPQEELPPETV